MVRLDDKRYRGDVPETGCVTPTGYKARHRGVPYSGTSCILADFAHCSSPGGCYGPGRAFVDGASHRSVSGSTRAADHMTGAWLRHRTATARVDGAAPVVGVTST